MTDVEWLAGLPEAAFARSGVPSEAGEVSGDELLSDAAYHDALHVAQIARMIGARFEALRGALRIY